MLGGLGLGILQAELAGFLPTNSVLSTGLRPSLPFVVLFLLLLLKPQHPPPAPDHRPAQRRRPAPAAAGRQVRPAVDDPGHPHLRRRW